MLNKIWASLIILGILFAAGQDIHSEVYNTYNNGAVLNIPYSSTDAQAQQILLTIDSQQLNADYKANNQIQIHLNNQASALLHNIALASGHDNTIIAQVISKDTVNLRLLLPELHWVKLRAITHAAFDMADFAVKLAIGLIGIMALWLGLMQVAEKSGLIALMVKFVQPILHWLFPGIPRNHPAFGSISMNMAANILGLGNAATPLGIKAMQQLQQLNPDKNRASDEMCMFLALNTSSVQLLPPVTLIALMGTQISELIVPIILATSCSTIAAVFTAKLYARYQRNRCNS